jgi:predicted NUDIX family NTP pyrophosphohydrolase
MRPPTARSRSTSAGILPFRRKDGRIEVFLVHPGGPYWAKKDNGAWSIAKGQLADEEDALDAAKREFAEETGIQPDGSFLPLTSIKQPGRVLLIEACARLLRSTARVTRALAGVVSSCPIHRSLRTLV